MFFNTAGPWLNLSLGGVLSPACSAEHRQRINSFSHLNFTSHRKSTWIISPLHSLILCVRGKRLFFYNLETVKIQICYRLSTKQGRMDIQGKGVSLVRGSRDFKHVFLISKFIPWSWVQWNTWEAEAGRVCAQASLDYTVRPCSK